MIRVHYKAGVKIGNCIYLEEAGYDGKQRLAKFRCVCGNEFINTINQIKGGRAKSCGCFTKLAKNKTHGLRNSKEYHIWSNIKTRCYNQNAKTYEKYGAVGITMSDEWKDSFETFYKDMGNCPSEYHSIDRLENDKGYYKENCKWSNDQEQARNRTNNIYLEYNNIRKPIWEWAEEIGASVNAIKQRLHRGWSDKETLTTPFRVRN